MNKAELIEAIALDTEMTKTDVEKVVSSLVNVITKTLVEDEKVSVKGFGSFEVRNRDARKGRNPRTGEEIELPPSRLPAFKASRTLKKALNKKD